VAKATLRAAGSVAVVDPVVEPAPDERAPGFAELYEDAYPEMARLAVLLVGSQEGAHDIVQESFVKLHRSWHRAENPRAYLRRIVVNECTTYHRRRFRHLRVQPMLVAEPVTLEADEISDALAGLSPRERAAIVLRFWHDCSEKEIADVLGCKPGTVGSLIHRGLGHLREVIEP
jgi:RNA polymerase sigma factor (sigma-70 family)